MITIPTQCPSCHSKLERVGPNLFCRNKECGAVGDKVLKHFATTLKIKGLGPVALKKLGFKKIMDIYRTPQAVYCEALGMTIGPKVFREVENSRTLSFNQVLPGLSIPLIGKAATEKLAAEYKDLTEVYLADTLDKVIGPAAAKKMQTWLSSNTDTWEYLPQKTEFEPPVEYRKTVCMTGRLKTFTSKASATKELNRYGYRVAGALSQKVDFLINESGNPSAKTKQAEKLGISIITNIEELLKNE